MKTQLNIAARVVLSMALCLGLAACMGIPLRSIPRLYSLQSQLLDSNPSEFMLAVQVDTKMTPPVGAAPILQIKVTPEKIGAYVPIDKNIVLRAIASDPERYRLPDPTYARRWLIYALPPEAQAELAQAQAMFRKLRAQKQTGDTSKSNVTLGIAFDALAVNAPQFANTRFETWLQASTKEGFFEMWSGTVSQVFAQAKR